MENYFKKLNSINVNDKTEKKGNLTYLSWAWAWGEVKKLFPDTTYTIYENADGLNYHTDGKTCWVKTGVTINGLEHIEYLPVMDLKNKSLPLAEVTSFDVNKAIQRSLTKALARHGLGLYIYAGEDLPEDSTETNPSENKGNGSSTPKDYIDDIKKATLLSELHRTGWNAAGMLEYLSQKFPDTPPKDLNSITIEQFTFIAHKLEKRPTVPEAENGA